jgi:hypothetical protein
VRIHTTPSGSRPFDRLVEHQHRRIAQQCGGDAEPLGHAEGEPAGPPARGAGQPDQVQDLIDAAAADPVAQGQAQQMVAGTAPTVEGPGFQQRPCLEQRTPVGSVRPAADCH